MAPWELERRLSQIERARGTTARRLAHEIRAVHTEPWFDARWATAMREAFRVARLPPPRRDLPALATGESWVLLHDPSPNRGIVARLVVSARAAEIADCAVGLHEARLALGAACAKTCRTLPACVAGQSARILPPPTTGLVGRSHGLPAVAALVSTGLGYPARSDTAASATTEPDGTLKPVQHLAAKLDALRASRPEVTRLVVSTAQAAVEVPGIELVYARDVEQGLAELGLALSAFAPTSLGAHHARILAFPNHNLEPNDGARWSELSRFAWEGALAFSGEQGDPRLAAESATWAALFALHAGDDILAERALALVHEQEDLPPQLRVFSAIVEASAAIDRAPAAAPSLAVAALSSCEQLDVAGQALLRGLALGTLGRAHLHRGSLFEAERWLRAAVAHHLTCDEKQAARSYCHLATCLRLADRLDEAASAIDLGQALAAKFNRWPGPQTTLLYLGLEQGRCWLARKRPIEALAAFATAAGSQTDYPRAAALRGTAQAKRLLGDHASAHQLALCCAEIALGASGISRRTAMLAIGDALLAAPSQEQEGTLRARWLAVFPEATSEFVRETVSTSIY